MAELTGLEKRTPFSGWPMIILWIGMLVFTFHACTHMVAAGDTWVALACGRHFVNHGVDTVEPFSANSHKAGPTEAQLEKYPQSLRPLVKKLHPTGWINQNWGTHVIFYTLAKTFGSGGEYNYNTLIYWKFAVNVIAVICVFYLARVLGVNSFLAAIAASFSLFVGRSFIDVRPAVFSNMLVPIVLLIMALATYRNIKYIWLLVPTAVFWGSVHGGYIYIFIMLIPFVGLNLLVDLGKKWTVSILSIGTWLVLYALSYKFLSHEYYKIVYARTNREIFTPESFHSDGFFWFLIVLIIASLIIAASKQVKMASAYALHLLASIIVFLGLLARFFISIPLNITGQYREMIKWHFSNSQKMFVFLFLASIILGILVTFFKHRLISIKTKGILHTIAAGAAALLAIIIFSPFHLTNLTHTFEISVSKHAEKWRMVNEWKPAFDWMDKTTKIPNPVGHEEAFGVMLIIAMVVIPLWLVVKFLKPRPAAKNQPQQNDQFSVDQYEWPKIDLAILAVSALTVYMAIRSRRFIPIAAVAACPFIAMFLQQTIEMLTVKINFYINSYKHQHLSVPRLSKASQMVLTAAAAVAICIFGSYWAKKFKRIYLDPWPNDAVRDSIFMRMTASNLKPFDACSFIRENKLSGNMFNYWTEGGAIAFGQDPDQETGKTPLQLFMDGRAQAAYNIDKFDLWQEIKAGGLRTDNKHLARRTLTKKDFAQIGNWINKKMKKYDVWLILMPKSQVPYKSMTNKQKNKSEYLFINALQTRPNWTTVYVDNHQRLFVDIGTEKGKKIMADVIDQKAIFPNEFTKNLTLAGIYLGNYQGLEKNYAFVENFLKDPPARINKGFIFAKNAFEENPSHIAVLTLLANAARYTHLAKPVSQTIEKYLKDFIQNKDKYEEEGGYAEKIMTAITVANRLVYAYKKTNPKLAKSYRDFAEKHKNEPGLLSKNAVW